MELARFVMLANKERIVTQVELFGNQEIDQLRLIIDVDVMNLVDAHCKPVQISSKSN